jgi:hypothetical protein
MAQWRILSWNVETFGETKGSKAINFIGRVIHQYGANMVLFLETTKIGGGFVMHEMLNAFNFIPQWKPFGSEIAGKTFDMPPEVAYSKMYKSWRTNNWPYLANCYDDDPANLRIVLKPQQQWQNISDTLMALEYSGAERPDYETYNGLIKYDPPVSTNERYLVPGCYIGLQPIFSHLESVDGQGQEIGYRNPQSIFNGRAPFMLQIVYANPSSINQNLHYFPLISFHAPFGEGAQAMEMRIQAINGLLRLNTRKDDGSFDDLQRVPRGIISGDFNVDYTGPANCDRLPMPIPNTASVSDRTYCPLSKNDFSVLMGEKSSLKRIRDSDVPNARANWLQSSDYLSNAYDNIMAKGELSNASEDPQIIDLIQDIYDSQLAPGGNYLTGFIPVQITSMYDAYFYYFKNISDHLPALGNFEVRDRP